MLTKDHFRQLLAGSLPDAQARQVLSALQPEAIDEKEFFEIVAQLEVTADKQFHRLRSYSSTTVDCCGTGGSGLPRFNTSTAVAFVVAAAGVKVAKFGNRAASSKSGSFDVLDNLGIPAQVSGDLAERLLDDCNIVFLFAPQVYKELSRLAPIRRSIPHKTVLNFVGPLLNPVHPQRRLVGVSDRHMQELLASYLSTRSELSCVVQADCGLDEICPGCQTKTKSVGSFVPPALEFPGIAAGTAQCANRTDTQAPSPETNARVTMELFDGATDNDAYGLVLVNAAAVLLLAGRCGTLAEARSLAAELLAGGKVKEHYKKVIDCYAKHSS
jgi:anthranilate phosphoribosyltransferase